jgi:hypothetical protein
MDEEAFAEVKHELEEKARRGVLVESSRRKSSSPWWDRLIQRLKRRPSA